MTTTTQRAVAWRLICNSTSGGKVYGIAVIDKDVVVTWGRLDQADYGYNRAGTQQKVHRLRSHEAALVFVREQTAIKEKKGYVLDIAPVVFTSENDATFLTPTKGSVSLILLKGKPL